MDLMTWYSLLLVHTESMAIWFSILKCVQIRYLSFGRFLNVLVQNTFLKKPVSIP